MLSDVEHNLAINQAFAHARNSTSTVYRWLGKVPWEAVQAVQEACQDVMPKLGYVPYENEEQYLARSPNFWDVGWDWMDLMAETNLL